MSQGQSNWYWNVCWCPKNENTCLEDAYPVPTWFGLATTELWGRRYDYVSNCCTNVALVQKRVDEKKVVGYRCNSCQVIWQCGLCYFWDDVGWAFFLVNLGHVCGRGGILWCENPNLNPNFVYLGSFNENRLVGWQCNSSQTPWKSQMCYFGIDFGLTFFWPIQAMFVATRPLCDVRTPSWARITLLRVI